MNHQITKEEMQAFEHYIGLQEFYDELEKHDWYNQMSDDIRVERAGAANYSKLYKIAKTDPVKMELMIAYNAYMFSGNPWSAERKPKPGRPE